METCPLWRANRSVLADDFNLSGSRVKLLHSYSSPSLLEALWQPQISKHPSNTEHLLGHRNISSSSPGHEPGSLGQGAAAPALGTVRKQSSGFPVSSSCLPQSYEHKCTDGAHGATILFNFFLEPLSYSFSSRMRQTSTMSQDIHSKLFGDCHLLFTHCKSLLSTNCRKGIRIFKAINLLITMASLCGLQEQPCHLVRNSGQLFITGLNLPENSKEMDKTVIDFSNAKAFITRTLLPDTSSTVA